MSQADTQVLVHPDALELVELLQPTWPEFSRQLRVRPTLVCEETEEEKKAREEREEEERRKKAGAEKKPPWGSDEEFDPARAWKLITDLRDDNAKLKSDNEELRGKVQEHEDASKSDQEKLTEGKTAAEKAAAEAGADAARLRVALNKGLTETQAKRLVGDTPEELEADAEELLESFKTEGGESGQEPRRRPTERLRPGAAPGAEPEETSPAKLAEQVPRSW